MEFVKPLTDLSEGPGASQVAAFSTTVAGTYFAQLVGTDPWTWAIGGVGAAIVYAKKEATSRLDAIANGIISVLLAGIVAPEATRVMAAQLGGMHFDNPYPLAFLLSAAWPWVLPALSILTSVGGKLISKTGDTK
jgi:hypothetical protein